MKAYPRIIVAVPCERNLYTEAAHSLMAIVHQGFPFMAHGYARVDRTRNDFAIQLLKSDFTHVLMLDSDHIHPSDIVQQLGRHVARNPDLWVIGGLNFRRGEPYDPCAYYYDENHRLCPIYDYPPNALLRVEVLGSGSILIAREVFETLPFPWFGYDYSHAKALGWPDCSIEDLESAQYPGTDIWFSRACVEHGIDQWVYTGVSSPHLIHTTVTQEVRDAFLAKARAHGEILTARRPPDQAYFLEDPCENEESSAPGGKPTPEAESLKLSVGSRVKI